MALASLRMPAHRQKAAESSMPFALGLLLSMVATGFARPKEGDKETGEEGSLSINAGLSIVGVIIGAVVSIAILAALAPTYFTSLGDIGGVFTDPSTTTGNTDADALLPVFGLLVAFGGLFAIVGLIMLGVKLNKSG